MPIIYRIRKNVQKIMLIIQLTLTLGFLNVFPKRQMLKFSVKSCCLQGFEKHSQSARQRTELIRFNFCLAEKTG